MRSWQGLSTRSSHFQEPLRLELSVSQRLRLALSGLAAFALCAIFFAAIPPVPRLTLVVLLLIHLAWLLRRQARLVGYLLWRGDDWSWIDGACERTLLLQQATVWPALIVLRFREPSNGRTWVFTLLADSCESDMQRRLRVFLRLMPVFELPALAMPEVDVRDRPAG